MAGNDTTKSLDKTAQELSANPMDWFSGLSEGLGLSPGDQPGVGTYSPNENQLYGDQSITALQGGKRVYKYDPHTGQTFYVDDSGVHIVENPVVAEQVAAATLRQREHDARAGVYGERESDVFGQQGELAGYLNDVIAGKTPSVAERQLGAGLDTIRRSALSMSAGAGGATAPLMQLAAIQAGSQAGAKANQDASINRAAEIAQARGELAVLLNAMEGSSRGLYEGENQLAYQYGDQALRGQSAQQGLQLQSDAAGAKGTSAVMSGIAQAYGIGGNGNSNTGPYGVNKRPLY